MTQVLATSQHLRSCITGRAAEFPAEAKIGQLWITAFVEQDILEFEVPMDDAFAVNIAETETDLAEYPARLGFGEAGLLDEIVEELSAGAELGDEPDGVLGGDDLVELDDVWVVESPVVVDFAGEQRRGGGFGYVFEGDAGAGEPMDAQMDGAEAAWRTKQRAHA